MEKSIVMRQAGGTSCDGALVGFSCYTAQIAHSNHTPQPDLAAAQIFPRSYQGNHESGQGQARSLTTIKLVELTRLYSTTLPPRGPIVNC